MTGRDWVLFAASVGAGALAAVVAVVVWVAVVS